MGKDDIFRKRKEQKTAELERQLKERIQGPRYLIVCEGRKTERFYFKGICDAHRLSTVRVTHSELGPSPSSVVECALKLYESDATQGLDPYDTVYCVIDRDKHTTYDAALRRIEVLRAEGKPFEGIPSIPCFEYWLLLHFTYTRQFFQAKGKKSICDALIRDELRNQDGFADYDKGLKDFADIARFEKELQGKIHGIEPGSDGNALIAGMIRDGAFGLKNFQLVESSEIGMLTQAHRAVLGKKAIVFLGWEPHPMNIQLKLRYLAGGDAVFGPNLGEAKVYTAVPSAYEARCPNVAAFLKNLQFTIDMESQVMGPIMERVNPNLAARNFLKKYPAVLGPWLAGVASFDGRDGLAEVAAALKR